MIAWSQTANKFIHFYGVGAKQEATEQAETCSRGGDITASETGNWTATAIREARSLQNVATGAFSNLTVCPP
jgi:hypothetical protein